MISDGQLPTVHLQQPPSSALVSQVTLCPLAMTRVLFFLRVLVSFLLLATLRPLSYPVPGLIDNGNCQGLTHRGYWHTSAS